MSANTLREGIITELQAIQPAAGRTYNPPAGQGWNVPSGSDYAHSKAMAESYANAIYAEYGTGFAWQQPVLDRWDASTSLPASPSVGDRYLCATAGNGWALDSIYEWAVGAWTATPPQSGAMVWVMDESRVYVYTGSAWEQLGTTVELALNNLTDVTVSSPAEGQVLRYAGSTWANAQLGHAELGGVSANQHHDQTHTLTGSDHTASGLTTGHFLKVTGAGSFAFQPHGLSADDLNDVTISSPGTAQVLRYDGTSWANAILGHADLGSVSSDQHHDQSHALTGSDHTASGLTSGHFLKATGNNTFAFEAHGLSASDVGAEVPLTFSGVLQRSSNDITLNWTSNLRNNGGSLDTVQNINTTASPEFAHVIASQVRRDTSDGSDSSSLYLCGGGSEGTGRGGTVALYGNEAASRPGDVRLRAGGLGSVVLGTDAGSALTVDESGDITLHHVTASKVLGTNASKEIATVDRPQFERVGVGTAVANYTAVKVTPTAVSNEGRCWWQGNGNVGFRMGYATNQTDEAAHFLTLNTWSYNDSTGSMAQDESSYVSLMEYWQAAATDANSGWWWAKGSAGATAWSPVANLTSDGVFSVDNTVVDYRYHGTPDSSGSWRTMLNSGDWAVQFWLDLASAYVSALEISDSHAQFNVTLQTTTALYFGGSTTDGSWRLVVGSGTMYLQKRVSGSWTTKDSWT